MNLRCNSKLLWWLRSVEGGIQEESPRRRAGDRGALQEAAAAAASVGCARHKEEAQRATRTYTHCCQGVPDPLRLVARYQLVPVLVLLLLVPVLMLELVHMTPPILVQLVLVVVNLHLALPATYLFTGFRLPLVNSLSLCNCGGPKRFAANALENVVAGVEGHRTLHIFIALWT
jgi:hypothetical protein